VVLQISVRDHRFAVDEPSVLGGTDTAANPVEYALAALGSCQVITYQFWAAKLGIPVDTVTVSVEGHRTISASGSGLRRRSGTSQSSAG
jgi:uncharacterized OsmC-like protein